MSCESACDTLDGPHLHSRFKEPGQAPGPGPGPRRLFSAPPDFSPGENTMGPWSLESGNDTSCEGEAGAHITRGLPLQYLGRGPDF